VRVKVLGHRVDAYTVAGRVALSDELIAALRERQDVARRHGRASFEWFVDVPASDDDERRPRVGETRASWAHEPEHGLRRAPKIWVSSGTREPQKCG